MVRIRSASALPPRACTPHDIGGFDRCMTGTRTVGVDLFELRIARQ
ncbi:MAG TPA: hypothetical protein VF339_05370 [Gammaproteobacteria bacterium]